MKSLLLIVLLCVSSSFAQQVDPPCLDEALDEQLIQSTVSPAAVVSLNVNIPLEDLWAFFANYPQLWPQWNYLFSQVNNTKLEVCQPLNAGFNILPKIQFPPGTQLLPPTMLVANISADSALASWSFKFVQPDGTLAVYGRHDYQFDRQPDGTTMFTSWGKAFGPFVSSDPSEWHARTFNRGGISSMRGAACLENVFSQFGKLIPDTVIAQCKPSPY
eukprot:TRINITY_DN7840_c0_g1_i1.p1 TRINITY_DN7840_c0_g1~~TRINITY_DN7840_c0_g1_i1.p1  ORF type:complete len:217 (-),score=33.45 TRINITY_DN7840_c0_g1_i1:10-660(-)